MQAKTVVLPAQIVVHFDNFTLEFFAHSAQFSTMSKPENKTSAKAPDEKAKSAEKQARLSEALRANLRRRNQQRKDQQKK